MERTQTHLDAFEEEGHLTALSGTSNGRPATSLIFDAIIDCANIEDLIDEGVLSQYIALISFMI